jgi:hypothetical protein
MVVLSALSKTIQAQPQVASIGSITELKGVGRVVREQDPFAAALAFGINSFDNVETSQGRIGITFLDESQVRLTEHSQLVIDEFIYDPDPSKSKMALQFASGTARFITGKLATIDKENILIQTPSATIGIRGTDFTVTVDEIGRSLIILLPKEDGLASGEIVVSTAAGQVVLNKPYEATTVELFESAPSRPVILDLTLDIIDNMLIVNPPKEDPNFVSDEQQTEGSDNILDIDYLEFDELEQDYLAEDNLEFTELDINYLDVNFLEDLLDIIQEVDELDQNVLTVGGVDVQGTAFGYDADTQINTFLTDTVLTFYRQVEDTVRLDLDTNNSYKVLIIQDGKAITITLNGGSDSSITIKQSG